MKKLVSIMFAVMLIALSVVPAFAVDSPDASTKVYTVVVDKTTGGGGTYEFTSGIDKDGNQHVHLTPIPNQGYTFDHWEIEGPYTPGEKLENGDYCIIITGDVVATPYYKANTPQPSGATEPVTIHTDDKPVSPKTGANDAMLYVVIALAVVACGFASFKLVKSK